MTKKSKTKLNFIRFFLNNWFLAIFFACIAFVGVVSFYKLFVKQENFVYARVKVSQGLWWASTQKPPLWLAQALKPQDQAKDLAGEPKVTILAVRTYPYFSYSQYDVYVDLRLKVSGELKSGTVNFNRSTLGIGSPIELTFPTAEVTGTVIALSPKPMATSLKWHTIVLVKQNAYQWEYDAINIGDSYFDGQEKVLEIVDKRVEDNLVYGLDTYGSYWERSTVGFYPQPRKLITATVKIKAQEVSKHNLLYGFEQELRVGRSPNLSTNTFYFQDYQLAQVD